MTALQRPASVGMCLALWFCACAGESERPRADAGVDTAPDSSPAFWGAIELQLQEEIPGTRGARSLVIGKAYDGPPVQESPLVVTRQVGACQLLTPIRSFCSPACGGDRVCAPGNICQPYPRSQNIGTLQVEGLGAPVVLEPIPPSFSYQSAELPYPPCAEGAGLSLTAFGGTSVNHCIAPLRMSRETPLPVRRGQPLGLTWTAPERPELSRIEVRLDIAHHGGQKTGEIMCNVADNGAYEVPATLIDALIDLGLAGLPSVILTRFSSVHSAAQPNVRFSVLSRVERPVDTGVISCFEDSVCPPDQTCDRMRLICARRN